MSKERQKAIKNMIKICVLINKELKHNRSYNTFLEDAQNDFRRIIKLLEENQLIGFEE